MLRGLGNSCSVFSGLPDWRLLLGRYSAALEEFYVLASFLYDPSIDFYFTSMLSLSLNSFNSFLTSSFLSLSIILHPFTDRGISFDRLDQLENRLSSMSVLDLFVYYISNSRLSLYIW